MKILPVILSMKKIHYHLKQETVTGNGPIMQSVNALQSQGDKIAEVAAALGITISVVLPD